MHKKITKAPHYYLVHFEERFTSVKGTAIYGKPFVVICDNIPVNVYGFASEDEARAFDPLKLRTLLIGGREQQILWNAPDEKTLLEEINNDQRVKDKVFTLSSHALHGNIENLPECSRMYKDSEGMLLCGKPENDSNDGCCGGCVLQGFDQNEEFYDGFKCPMHKYWNERLQLSRENVA
ncbi:MAG TPA: hypothetical protein VG982_01710 [Candidatus Paceibacterota bacterium]|nr:hypothetical protein [Candidatus Paceibacterota bacterium]